MRDGNVVALEIVVDVNLPIAVDHVVAALGEFQTFELEAAHLLGNLSQAGGERLGVEIEIHKDKLAPGFAAQRHHAHGAAVEEFDAIDVRRANQAAVERVGPAMILAAQNVFAAAAERDGPGAMTADIAEGAQLALLVAHDDHWLADDICREKTLRIRNSALDPIYFAASLMESTDELPGTLKDAGFFYL